MKQRPIRKIVDDEYAFFEDSVTFRFNRNYLPQRRKGRAKIFLALSFAPLRLRARISSLDL